MVRMAGIAAIAAGCVVVEQREELEELTFDEAPAAVVVVGGSGDLTVEADSGSQTLVSRTLRYTGERPEVVAKMQGDVLRLELKCRTLQRVCAIDQHVVLPETAALDASIGSGNLVASGLQGEVIVDIGSGNTALTDIAGQIAIVGGSGNVRIEEASGTVDIDIGSGEITLVESDIAEARIDSGSGDVDLAFTKSPDRVVVDGGSGDVAVEVPSGSYRVEADTGSGRLKLDGITADRSASSVLRVDTGSGNITLTGR